MDFLHHFPNADIPGLTTLLKEKQRWIAQDKKGFLRYRRPLHEISHLHASQVDFSDDQVKIGAAADLTPANQKLVKQALINLKPWRKGPFSIFDIEIDAEWRSERKWNRILPELPSLEDKVIADIGCNNGYYMFRMLYQKPRFVLGFEPYVHHYFTFQTLNSFAAQDNLRVELLGIENLDLFPESFDLIFCLGILYHRPSPIAALQDLHAALKPGGELLIESQAIPGETPVALFPESTYAKAPGTWFVPTASCLENWIRRCGFSEVNFFCSHPMSSEEQRKTTWMDFESYEDFIDKNAPELTIEGYPAPIRVFFKVKK